MTSGLLQKNLSRNKSVSSTKSDSSSTTVTPVKSLKFHSLSSNFVNNDKSIKTILKHFKRLEIGLGKFNSKQNGVLATNILRTVLLPFLRSKSFDFLLNDIPNSIGSKVYKSLISILSSLLVKWWTSILHSVINNFNLSNFDRSAYLECISRIICRKEWFLKQFEPLIDTSTFNSYNDLLTLTLDYSINRLASIKHLPLSISAFVGKVFACAFFKLEGVSNALLFLLNVKQSVFEENLSLFPVDSCDMKSIFPNHLQYLLNFKGLQNTDLSKHQKRCLNCLVPPKQKVKGIEDPTGVWVSRWLNSDSDLFNSFLRHYLNICSVYLSQEDLELNDLILLNLPGFNILLAHIFQIFQTSIIRISNSAKVNQDFPGVINNIKSPNDLSVNPQKQNDVFYNSIFKIFRTLRDVKFNHQNSLFVNSIIHYIDVMLMNFAKQITVYELNKTSLILNIVYEFVTYLDDIDWDFWLNCCFLMINNSEHVQISLKNICFLFNVWDNIPDTIACGNSDFEWIKNPSEPLKKNFTSWMISKPVWEKFFIHWNPTIRNYYLRFLIWKVIGINNFESSNSIEISMNIQNRLIKSFEKFREFYNANTDKKYHFKPDNLALNKKLIISPITNDEFLLNELTQGEDDKELSKLFTPKELKKTHPFEIFDEAIYSCSNIPQDEAVDETKRSNSLVNSIGKIFKMLTVDDKSSKDDLTMEKPTTEFNSNSKSVSLTSLSTHSLKSRSSSPLLLSFSSNPTDFSETSSSITNTSTDLEQNKSQELFNLPPDIIRPVYRFEQTIDYIAIRDKFQLMGRKRLFHDPEYYKLPNQPRIPSVSIYLKSDVYNKFYISTDSYFLSDQYPDSEPDLFVGETREVNLMNLGKSLFQWNNLVEEFETYLINKVEVAQVDDIDYQGENEYFRKIIPLLGLDANLKTLNAA